MVMMASLAPASSAGVAATVAPTAASGLALSAERFHTVTLWPTSINRCAMAAPIRPRPATPTFIGRAPMVTFDDRRRLAAEKGLAGAYPGEYAPTSRLAETKGATMHLIMLLLAIHLVAAVFWVGGMAFAYTVLR